MALEQSKKIKPKTKTAVAVSSSTEKPATKKKAAKKPKKAKKKKKKKANYVNPADFLQDITDFYESGTDVISEKLGVSVFKIATGLSYAPNFINYSYKDEMVGDAILKMMMAIKNKKFNIVLGHNPFSYFTTIAFHAFINRIKKEKKHRETITQYQEKVWNDLQSEGEFSDINVYVEPETSTDPYSGQEIDN